MINFERYITAYNRLSKQLDVICAEYKAPKTRFWIDALYCFVFHGASPRDYVNFEFFRLNHVGRKQFLTMRRTHKIERMFNDPKYAQIFNNKEIFNHEFSQFVKRKWIYAPDKTDGEIIGYIQQMKKVIVKPTNLSSGKGIFKLSASEIDNIKDFCSYVKEKKCLIEEFIVQHQDISKLNPITVNTIRVYTIIDASGGCDIIFAAIRVGSGQGDVDNFHAGGVGYPLDIGTGYIKQQGVDINGKQYLHHPSSNTLMLGYKIPMWEELKKFILQAAMMFPKARYIGWDVAVTQNGFEMVEGNYMADPGLLQTLDKQEKYQVFKERY